MAGTLLIIANKMKTIVKDMKLIPLTLPNMTKDLYGNQRVESLKHCECNNQDKDNS